MTTNPDFIIFPAIDLRGGQVVRLKEGDPNRQTNYSTDPAQVARRWIDSGASWLHVVNLDGAFDQPDQANRQAVEAILAVTAQAGVKVQFGGGLRSLADITAALQTGVTRVMIGTLAIEQPEVFGAALQRWGGERVGLSPDARGGRVQVRGWQGATGVLASDLVLSFKEQGLRWVVYTDIERDGLQTGLNLPATIELAKATGVNVIASGGVSSEEDIEQSRQAGLAGVIIGKALYEGAIDLARLFQSKGA